MATKQKVTEENKLPVEPATNIEPAKEEIKAEAKVEEKPKAATKNKSNEELLKEFCEKQKEDFSLNDFLKTLPQVQDTATHLRQLSGLISKSGLKIDGNSHLQLGKNYYDADTAKQSHFNLDDVNILVKK